jgi:hypothetical protein
MRMRGSERKSLVQRGNLVVRAVARSVRRVCRRSIAGIVLKRIWQDRTGRDVVIAVTVKLCLVAVLWVAFVRDATVHPDSAEVGAAVLRLAPSVPAPAREPAR